MSFYTNVAMQSGKIYLRGYEDGKRVKQILPFRPYLYLPSKEPAPFKTLNGSYVNRVDFQTDREAKAFIKRYEDVSNFQYHGYDKWPYVFIHDNYPEQVAYDANKIRVVCIDIEVDIKDGYPKIDLADKFVTAITLGYKSTRIGFGLKPYTSNRPNFKYYHCKDEHELLLTFLHVWETIDPDVVTGWNVSFFDIPYMINRIRRELGDTQAKRMSPWGILRDRTVFMYGRDHTVYNPVGISILDYQDLYKEFTYVQRDSYSLNNIASIELNEKKIDYSEYGNLDGLYERDFQKYMDYNIHDVDLVFKLDDKMKLIELVYAIAYDAHVNFADALTTVTLWDVIIYNYLASQNIVVPKYGDNLVREIAGGFVKDPVPGMYDWVVSFDLTSLYPHLIMQYNIGPDTFVRRLGNITPDLVLEGTRNRGDFSMAANGCLYRKDKQSFLAALMELQFKQRVLYKDKMIAAKKAKEKASDKNEIERLESEISRYTNAQMAKKIQLNSAYGAFGNKHFRYYDPNHAEAITLSGQLSIRWIARYVNEHMNKACNSENVDYIIAIDTDSLYVNFGALIDQDKPDSPVDHLDAYAKQIMEPLIKQGYEDLAAQMGAYKNAMQMKREAIGSRAIWLAKKRYMMNVLDNEGVRFKEPDLKVMGLEAVRSSTPQVCRQAIKDTIKVIMNQSVVEVREYVEKFKEEWKTLPFEEISFPRGVNGLTEYGDSAKIYKSGTPIHVRASLMYNKLLKDKKDKRLVPIYEGDKIKFAYLKMPNPTNENIIACPGFFPFAELMEYIDYDLQFEKAYLQPITNILDAIKWNLKEVNTLESLFG
jgi:DNA polymerase elongation subunit (family B)